MFFFISLFATKIIYCEHVFIDPVYFLIKKVESRFDRHIIYSGKIYLPKFATNFSENDNNSLNDPLDFKATYFLRKKEFITKHYYDLKSEKVSHRYKFSNGFLIREEQSFFYPDLVYSKSETNFLTGTSQITSEKIEHKSQNFKYEINFINNKFKNISYNLTNYNTSFIGNNKKFKIPLSDKGLLNGSFITIFDLQNNFGISGQYQNSIKTGKWTEIYAAQDLGGNIIPSWHLTESSHFIVKKEKHYKNGFLTKETHYESAIHSPNEWVECYTVEYKRNELMQIVKKIVRSNFEEFSKLVINFHPLLQRAYGIQIFEENQLVETLVILKNGEISEE